MSENNQLAGKSTDPKDHIKTMSVKNYVSLAQKCPHIYIYITTSINHIIEGGFLAPHIHFLCF